MKIEEYTKMVFLVYVIDPLEYKHSVILYSCLLGMKQYYNSNFNTVQPTHGWGNQSG